MNPDQSSESSDATTVVTRAPATCPICEEPLVFERGDGVCDACSMDTIYQLQRVSDYARALERNGVAAGTIKRLRSIHLEEGDLLATGDMPAKQSQALARASGNVRSQAAGEGSAS